MKNSSDYLMGIEIDDKSVIRRNEQIENERRIAVADLLERNYFAPKLAWAEEVTGPYHLLLRIEGDQIVFDLTGRDQKPGRPLTISLIPFRSVIKEYFLIVESHFKALKVSNLSQIEAIDMGRRAVHNEGAEILVQRLKNKIDLDEETARRLFTLLCVLQIKA